MIALIKALLKQRHSTISITDIARMLKRCGVNYVTKGTTHNGQYNINTVYLWLPGGYYKVEDHVSCVEIYRVDKTNIRKYTCGSQLKDLDIKAFTHLDNKRLGTNTKPNQNQQRTAMVA